ncbi:rho GTPase-activating protein REN1-like [Phragmites australis]|uniref:rho GTPase-activating protein REN1-like n=1 Tax=Phragmites australis TaxID=29695 RepID=UPI002D785C8F|nr:rho GTPase-activating protein REN1-like [Phragmites australis]
MTHFRQILSNQGSRPPSSTDKLAHQKQQLSTGYKRVTSTEQPGTTNQRAQNTLSSKGEVAKDSQDGSFTSKWNFAQGQYSNNPLIGRLQGSNAYSSTKTKESGAAPPSALTKLTSLLNFLKERTALLASEMQNLDLARPQGPTAPPPKRNSRWEVGLYYCVVTRTLWYRNGKQLAYDGRSPDANDACSCITETSIGQTTFVLE